jgi:hypothetical protein
LVILFIKKNIERPPNLKTTKNHLDSFEVEGLKLFDNGLMKGDGGFFNNYQYIL